MILLLLPIVLPLLAALAAVAWPSERSRPLLLPVTGLAHLAATFALAVWPPSGGDVLGVDALGLLVLLVLSGLFAVVSLYAPAYLRLRASRPNRVFVACLLAFLAMGSLACESLHLGLLWIALEATTLATAPLVSFNRNPRSIEATWKYVLLVSVGVALALLGTFAVAYGGVLGGLDAPLSFDRILAHGERLSRPWVRAGFILMLVGYGTKMGLAPLHAWKPDAYGEAPGLVGALLAGGLTSCAFLGVVRAFAVAHAAGEGAFARDLLIAAGVFSLLTAAIFLARQRDLKRMLAYSSVEHMGLLALGIGVGGGAVFFALLHVINNAFTKALLFLSAGNIHRAFGARSVPAVAGALRRVPISGALFLAGFLAITGTPPFAPFLSMFGIVRGTLASGHFMAGALALLALGGIFLGMSATVQSAVRGPPPPAALEGPHAAYRDSRAMTLPLLLIVALLVVLGLWIPEPLRALIERAASEVGR